MIDDGILKRLDRVQGMGGSDDDLLDSIKASDALIERRLTLRLDSGKRVQVTCWRCQHSHLLGPCKGGLRFHPEVSEEEVRSLAFKMTLKTALLGLPLGGAKGGVPIDGSALSVHERERLCRAWTRAFISDIGPNKDIPAPDVGCGPEEMAWIRDEYEQLMGKSVPHVVTGKPSALGGLNLRDGATARGGKRVLDKLRDKLGLTQEEPTVIVQGFGKVGGQIASLLAKDGYRIIGVSDSSGSLRKPEGFNVDDLLAAKEQGKSFSGLDNELEAEGGEPDAILTDECDLLVPAALGEQIHQDNADDIKASVILELANDAVSADADEILVKRDIRLVPDILANAGGVLASYHEWLAGKAGHEVVVETAEKSLDDIIDRAADRAWHMHKRAEVSLQTACYALAVEHLQQVARCRGLA